MEEIPLLDKELKMQPGSNTNLNDVKKYIINGNEVQVKELLNKTLQIMDPLIVLDSNGLSYLHYAVRHNRLNIVKLLVEYFQADVNIKSSKLETCLHLAAKYSRNEIRSQKFQESDSFDGHSKSLFTSDELDEILSSIANDTLDENQIKSFKFAQQNLNCPIEVLEKISAAKFDHSCTDDMVYYLLSKNANALMEDENGSSPLHIAIAGNNFNAFLQLISRSISSSDAKDKFGFTPLHQAMASMNDLYARVLVSTIYKDQSLNCFDIYGNSPLHIAAKSGFVNNARVFIESIKSQYSRTAKTNPVESKTPIHSIKASTDVEDYMDILNAKNTFGQTALHLAVQSKQLALVLALLKENVEVDHLTNQKDHALHLACQVGSLEITKCLMTKIKDVNIMNNSGMTPLHLGVHSKNVGLVKYLLEKGCKLEAKNSDAQTPLCLALKMNLRDIANLLMDKGASLRVFDKKLNTPLHLAVANGSFECTQLILDSDEGKKTINRLNSSKNSPIHIAIEKGQNEIFEMLIDLGANIYAKNYDGCFPIHLATKKGLNQILERICDLMPCYDVEDFDSKTPLHHSVLANNLEAFECLTSKGALHDVKDSEGNTPFMLACSKGSLSIVKFCIEKNFIPTDLSSDRMPPIHLASKFGHYEIVEELLRNGHDPKVIVRTIDFETNGGLNALDYAIENNHKKCALTLIQCKDHFPGVLKNLVMKKDGKIDSPLRKLIQTMPDVAKTVLDQCLSANEFPPDSDKFKVTYNFELLDDIFEKCENIPKLNTEPTYLMDDSVNPVSDIMTKDRKSLFQNHPLSLMVVHKREELIEHDVVVTLVKKKWKKFGIFLYYTNFLLFLLYLINVTGIILLDRSSGGDEAYYKSFKMAGFALICISVINIFKKIIQLSRKQLLFFKDIGNYTELFLYISGLVIAFKLDYFVEDDPIWMLTVIVLFTSWIYFIFMLRKMPILGIYVILLTKVAKTFFKFFILFALFIWTYAITFYVLFNNHDAYSKVYLSSIKTIIMSTGELDFGDLFFSEQIVRYKKLSFILYVNFVILVNIIIMNLLVGLAVDDIKSVLDESKLTKLSMQISLCLDIESSLLTSLLKKNVQRTLSFYPNQKRNWRQNFIPKLSRNKRQAEEDERFDMSRHIERLTNDLSDLKRQNMEIMRVLERLSQETN